MTTKTLLYVVNAAGFFMSHRLQLALAARAAGYQVHVAVPDSAEVQAIRAQGFVCHVIALDRRGVQPWQELVALRSLLCLYRRLRPDLAHLMTIKPVIYGGLAARLAGVPAVVSTITGLGYVFIGRDGLARWLRRLVIPLYRLALRHPCGQVIFQNHDDQQLFVAHGWCAATQARLIPGSGVDTQQFRPLPRAAGALPVVMLAGRLLWDKGVGEFVAAARQLRLAGCSARFVLVGASDPDNRAAISDAQLHAWQAEGVVECWGTRNDMPDVLNQADIVCLPSYREGLPRVLLEAAACGKPLIATDVPGCRELVQHGVNGLLVPARDSAALAEAIQRLLADPDERQLLGVQGRQMVDADYALPRIISATLAVYAELSACVA